MPRAPVAPAGPRSLVLIVSGDATLVAAAREAIEPAGVRVAETSGRPVGVAIRATRPRLIVLDARAPGPAIHELRRTLGRGGRPLLLVTSYREGAADAEAFQGAASDVILWPFRAAELRYRVERLVRRAPPEPVVTRRRAGPLEIDLATRTVRRGEDTVALMPSELRILLLMASAPGRVWSPARLADGAGLRVASDAAEPAVRTQVRRLRAKLEPEPKAPRYLQTVRGAGYRLNLDSA